MNSPDVRERDAGPGTTSTVLPMNSRLIDTWFPCPEVDKAVGTPAGSGLSEKALFTWFASRPIAQARAAVLCSLLTDIHENRADVKLAVLGDKTAIERLQERVADQYPVKPPVVLDMFSGRGIIALEAARAGATAIGTDLSPVATLAGRLLAEYALRDWSNEPPIPYVARQTAGADDGEDDNDADSGGVVAIGQLLFDVSDSEPRLLGDVRKVLAEVGSRVSREVAAYYPGNPAKGGAVPWVYLWAVTIPCDGCGRRFPMIGSMVLRHPYQRTSDAGQSMGLNVSGDKWTVKVHDGLPTQEPTFASPARTRGKSARCPFPDCGRVHSLDVVKAKGQARQYEDSLLLVGETDSSTNQKIFRQPRMDELAAAVAAAADSGKLPPVGAYGAIPDEPIPTGNKDNVRASGYGYNTYGSIMNPRQQLLFATTVRVIYDLFDELSTAVSLEYATALSAFAAANVVRMIKYATRGAGLQKKGRPDGSQQNRIMVDHIFSSQSVVKHQFDYLETGPSAGPGTWSSVSTSLLNALRKVLGAAR